MIANSVKSLRIWYCFIFTAILITFSSSQLFSQVNDCRIFCPNINWQSTGTSILNYGNCTFTVYWSYRYLSCLNPPRCEFKIDDIFKNIGLDTCLTTYNKFDIFQLAMKGVLKDAGLNTPCAKSLEPDSCVTTFSITRSGCWRLDSAVGPIGFNSLRPCLKEECCYDSWKLCLDSEGKPLDPEIIWHVGINPVCTQYCFAICENAPPSIPSSTESLENINQESGFKTTLFPNPTDNIINITINSNTKGLHVIEIVDNFGNMIITNNFTKLNDEESLQLNFSKYPSGNYRYIIKYDNKICISGLFNIVK